ncbi:MAG: glycolate oxidase subunit GlcE [Pseudomonadota bacterium]
MSGSAAPQIESLVQAVQQARAQRTRLRISGQQSKRQWFAAPTADAQMLCVDELRGIVTYQPEELVITALAGTSVKELEQTLLQRQQQLAFEPPQFFGSGTAGGMVASGLSGPARPWGGAVRDAVLGVEMINGRGEALNFGGQVMKNVAGYDVSRLMAGAFGALGVICSVSLRVQPIAEYEVTLRVPLAAEPSLTLMRSLAQQYSPLTGTWWVAGELHLRLAGAMAEVQRWSSRLQAEHGLEDMGRSRIWTDVRDHTADFFKSIPLETQPALDRAGAFLCRVIVPPATPQAALGESQDLAIEWAGGQRWMWHHQPEGLRQAVHAAGGWLWVLGQQSGLAAAIPAAQQQLMGAIKAAFDPDGVFVPAVALDGSAEPADAH